MSASAFLSVSIESGTWFSFELISDICVLLVFSFWLSNFSSLVTLMAGRFSAAASLSVLTFLAKIFGSPVCVSVTVGLGDLGLLDDSGLGLVVAGSVTSFSGEEEVSVSEIDVFSSANIATRSVVHLVRRVPELDPEPESPSQGSSLIQTLQDLQDWEERLDVICSSGKENICKVETLAKTSSLTAVNENCRDEVRKVVTGLTSKVDQLVAALQPVAQLETAAAKSGTPKPDADKPVVAQLEATVAKSDSLNQDEEDNSRQAEKL